LFWLARLHLPGYMNKIAELPFPNMISFSYFFGVSSAQVFTVIISLSLRFYASVQLFVGAFTLVVFLTVACFFDRGGQT
jgi:hypothetical protein